MTTPERIGRYEIIERVGRGGMGVLYRGRDTVLDREVAIKVMSTDFESDADESARPRFYREARAAAKLQHRNIVTIFEFGESENTPFIVMEFLRGQDLSKRMRAEPPLALEAKLDIVADLCTGLHFAHEQGVVHRDVKPANIWIQPDGSIKLLDFGIAKLTSSTVTRQGAVFGSVSYMAPEQVSGKEIDGRSDVFSAGIVLYELLTGRKPFEGDSPTAVLARIMDDQPASLDALPPEVPPPLAAAVAKALEKDRDKRYLHAADFGADLRLVRSALSAIAPSAEVDLTGALIKPVDTAHGPTLVREPAGSVQLVAAESPVVAAAAIAPARRRWLMLAALGLVVFLAAGGYFLAGSGSGPARPEDARSDATSGHAATNQPPAARSDAVPAAETPTQAAGQAPAAGVAQPTPGGPAGAAPGAGGRPAETPPTPAPRAVDITLSGSYPFEVVVGRSVVSPASESHRISITGRTALRLRAPEYFLDRQVWVDTGSRHVAAPELGRLSLRSSLESCSLIIAGRNLGEPPYEDLQIAAGSYSVQVSCPDGQQRRVPVTINAGELLRVPITK